MAEIYFNPFDPEFRANPYPHYQPLLGGPPVRINRTPPTVLVARYADVLTVLNSPENFSSEQPEQAAFRQLNLTGGGKELLTADPPVHSRLRRLVSRDFTPRRIAALEPRIRELTTQLLDRAAARGSLEVMVDLANQLPVLVIAEMLGVPSDQHLQFKHWSDTIIASATVPPGLPRPQEALDAVAAVQQMFAAEIEKSRQQPGPDLVSALVAHHDAEELTARELLAFLVLLLIAGNETTTNLIGNGLSALARHPEQLALLRERPELMPGAIDEMLRYDPPVQGVVRTARNPVDVGGTGFEVGDMVIPLIAAANRDPAEFSEPDRFDITRPRREHLAFGHGIHYCIGAPLARLEGATAVGGVLARFPRLRLDEERPKLAYKGSLFLRGLAALPMRID